MCLSSYYNAIGHGFKLGPIIGKILTEIALDLPRTYDLSDFKIEQ